MKTNRFTLLLNVAAVFSILFVSACSSATPTATPAVVVPPAATATAGESPVPAVISMPAQIAGGRPVAITVAGTPPDSQPTLLANWMAAVDRFQALYPNVTIRGTDYAYNPDTFAALVAGNQVPTLFQVYLTDPEKMVSQGIAADLTSLVQAQGLDQVYNPQVMSLVTVDGKIYGLPMKAYAMGLAYNKKLLEAGGFSEPPTTWEELETMAQALTDRANGVSGFSFIFGDPKQAGWHSTILAMDFGLQSTDIAALQTDGSYLASFDNAAMLGTLNLIHDLRWKYDVLPLENNDWPKNGEGLATGRQAMCLMASDQFSWIKQTFADVDMSQFGFAPLPAVNGTSVSQVGGDVAMISASATADQIEAAFYWRIWYTLDPGEVMTTLQLSASDPTVVVGGPTMPLYTGDYQAARAALDLQYSNLPVDYALFQEGIVSGRTLVMLEAPGGVAQDYYGILGPVVSTIVTDENADIPALLTAAQQTFQTNVLDLLR
jgi:ABC-type glycerol-3-phosphate transport system substrate-binding protein